jgi:hypothetical protein
MEGWSMLVTLMMIAMAAPNPAALNAPRKTYAACVKQFETKSLEAKMDAAAYSTALKGACASEAATLVKALIDFDVAMGGKKASAVASAESDVADYRITSEERFRDMSPAAKATATASASPAPAPAPVANANGAAKKVDASAPK